MLALTVEGYVIVREEPEGKMRLESRVNMAYPNAWTKLLFGLMLKLVSDPIVAEYATVEVW